MALQSPLDKLVKQYNGVSSAHSNINHSTVTLTLDLKPGTDLGALVQHVQDAGKSLIGSRSLQLNVTDHSNAALDKWWSEALFPISEAMENKKYTEIMNTLNQYKSSLPGLVADAEIDDNNVYISLSDGNNSKFIVLPRQAHKLGVWNNA